MSIQFDIEGLQVACWICIANLFCSGRSLDLQSVFTGHSHSGCLKNSGPFCQQLFLPSSVGCLPLVVQSAIFHLLSTHFQYSDFAQVWISPIRATNVLNPYDFFWIIALTIPESSIKYSFLNVSLVSSFMKFHNVFDKTVAFNSSLTTDSFLMSATLLLAAISLLSNLPLVNTHLTYTQVPKPCSDTWLNIMRLGSWLTSCGRMHRLNEILSISNNFKEAYPILL